MQCDVLSGLTSPWADWGIPSPDELNIFINNYKQIHDQKLGEGKKCKERYTSAWWPELAWEAVWEGIPEEMKLHGYEEGMGGNKSKNREVPYTEKLDSKGNNRMKQPHVGWKKIFANGISDKELMSKIYKQLLKLNSKNTDDPS